MSSKPRKTHVGAFIRQYVIPDGMSVKEAAERLGVGRPALSNLLNGKAALSPEMALRLEKAFGADRRKLLDLQAQSNHDAPAQDGKTAAVRTYVPNFLTIKARQIHDWAENNIEARQHLPVLLRMLVHSTGRELRQVDFPGYDNAERKGPDGFIDAGAPTAWIPEGKSFWEFGTTQNPVAKAEKDYEARLASIPPSERADCTFVFVTPHNWTGKTEWAKAKEAAGDWKAVRAFDASDLEQWLEESIPAQMWLAEKLSLSIEGCETLDQCWLRWSTASDPLLTPELFSDSITTHRADFKRWLEGESDRPFVIAADSRDEALAFLSCLFKDSEIALKWKDLTAVFHSPKTLRALASSASPFIPIVLSEETEREVAPLYRRVHCITVRPRNTVESEPDIPLDLLGYEAFRKALASMGIKDDRADFLDRESGRSPTILRRRLSKIDAIRMPLWVREVGAARNLIPMAMVGAWHVESKADCEVISALASRPYQEIEESLTQLLTFDDSPVWSVGQYRGVTSKIDCLFAINKSITKKDLADFFLLSEYVLSEKDPALDLPEDQRWAAGVYGKVRDHSAALRKGICETLVILSVHGNNLFQDRLGIDVEAHVSALIRKLLMPLTLENLLSYDSDLPRFAEAAPDEFLRHLRTDLAQKDPVILGLLQPARSALFGRCHRTGLLWALECLAWKPQNLPHVTAILAQLSRTKIDDNWANKPIASLGAIFRCWMPQTAASLAERNNALEMIATRFPDIGWQICLQQFELGPRMGSHSYRPHWRSDASGAGQPLARPEIYAAARKALDLAISWATHDEQTLGDLVERLNGMPEEDQVKVWDLIDEWSANADDERAKASLRERIRRFAFTRRGRRNALKLVTQDRAREAYSKLEARDPVVRHSWLFANQWVQESVEEMEDEAFDYSKREERIHKLRIEALREIWTARGFEGIETLLKESGAPFVVGRYAALCVEPQALLDFMRACLGLRGDLEEKADGCIQGFLIFLSSEIRDSILTLAASGSNPDDIIRLFRCAPFSQETWNLLNQYGDEIKNRYWKEVSPRWGQHSDAELTELVDRFLEANRPRAAFHVVHMDWQRIETSRLKRLLLALATRNAEPGGTFRLDAYDISAALKSLDGRAGVSTAEMAQLEFLYISALRDSEHGIPNLEKQIAESPALFVQALAFLYGRKDGGEDPPEWQINDSERGASLAAAAHDLLNQMAKIPGTDHTGQISVDALRSWVSEVRQLCAQYGRSDIGDYYIGELLSKAPGRDNTSWPCQPVCEVMEGIASERLADGFLIAVRNSRGVHWRGPGGDQERELAAKYRAWAQQAAFSYPFVSSTLETIARSYDREAGWQDSEEKVRERLQH